MGSCWSRTGQNLAIVPHQPTLHLGGWWATSHAVAFSHPVAVNLADVDEPDLWKIFTSSSTDPELISVPSLPSSPLFRSTVPQITLFVTVCPTYDPPFPNMVTPPTLDLPEAMRDRYKVESKLGQGAFGTALLVTDKVSNVKYVAKIMDLSQMTPEDKHRVKSEIDCLSQCDHVNIIRHIESYANDTTLVLVTEYAAGGNLGNDIRTRVVPFTSWEIACYFAQICLALDHVHAIFFTRNGLVKIGDFGFSKHHEETILNIDTPYYFAPEVWRGEDFSKKTDIWSVGIVLFEMMMLARPFTGDSMTQLSEAVRKGTIPAIPAGAYDDELVHACSLLLSVEAVDRPEIQDVLKFCRPEFTDWYE